MAYFTLDEVLEGWSREERNGFKKFGERRARVQCPECEELGDVYSCNMLHLGGFWHQMQIGLYKSFGGGYPYIYICCNCGYGWKEEE